MILCFDLDCRLFLLRSKNLDQAAVAAAVVDPTLSSAAVWGELASSIATDCVCVVWPSAVAVVAALTPSAASVSTELASSAAADCRRPPLTAGLALSVCVCVCVSVSVVAATVVVLDRTPASAVVWVEEEVTRVAAVDLTSSLSAAWAEEEAAAVWGELASSIATDDCVCVVWPSAVSVSCGRRQCLWWRL